MVTMKWFLRESLAAYLTAVQSRVVLADGAESIDEGCFAFGRVVAVGGGYRAHGAVRFVAHAGALDLLIASPEILIDAGQAALSTVNRAGKRTVVAKGATIGGTGSIAFDAALTAMGSGVFGGAYPLHAVVGRFEVAGTVVP